MSSRVARTPGQLLARAREIAGVDLVDEAAVEPLTALHRSLNEDADLSEEGARAQENKLLRLLANRLRMQRDFRNHPDIADQVIKGPIVVMGMARSGTTKTQKVLAASGDFNWLPFWMNYNWASFSGKPGESTEARIREADAYCRWFAERSPESLLGHPFETFEPEEDTILTEGCLVAGSFIGYAGVPSYLQWLAGQPPGIQFAFLRDALKYLQWQGLASPEKPWLLKAPLYCGLEMEILRAFPGARLVMAHRSPLKTLPSSCKLIQCFRKPFSESRPDYTPVVHGFFMAMQLHLEHRRLHPDWPMLDVSFDQLIGELPAALERIYRHAGIPLQEDSRNRMAQWDAEHRMHERGAFRYSLEEFGLGETQIRSEMSGYLAFLRTQFGNEV